MTTRSFLEDPGYCLGRADKAQTDGITSSVCKGRQ